MSRPVPGPVPGDAPRRILQVVGGLERGGIQIWLLQVLRHLDRERFRLDFLVHDDPPGALAAEIRAHGGGVLARPALRRPWRVGPVLAEVVATRGPYDVVHGHLHLYNGLILRAAARAGVPARIAHSHDDRRPLAEERRPVRRLYGALMRRWIRRHATLRLAVGGDAACDLFGAGWAQDPATLVLPAAIDLAPFAAPLDPAGLRAGLGLPGDALVVGHVGRLAPQKNHAFLLEVAARAMAREPRLRLLLVGEGPLEADLRARAAALHIAGRVVFAGGRDDVPALLRGAMDVLLFPSRHEGLGLALVEAQAAGLPALLAAHLPAEVEVVPELLDRLPLAAPVEDWAAALLDRIGRRPVAAAAALARVRASPFAIERSAALLGRIYLGEWGRGARGPLSAEGG
jgi:glycosyltransferase involved in cell wall biosynthesis